jgi:catechol 2,3-dioxygenase-like lactoylglutathione lyase family enzyme
MFDIGVHHVAFWVDDLDAVVNSLTAAGHPPFTGPVELDTPYYGEQPGGRVRTALLRDPDGNVVQFDQRV